MRRVVAVAVVSVALLSGGVASLLVGGVGAAPAATKLKAPTTTAYGTDPLQTVTLYPAGPTVAVLVHGGGFRSSAGMAKHLGPDAKNLQAAGITVAIVNYRTDKKTGLTIADEVDDVVAGTHYAMNATGASQVSMIGGSSGGTLASDAAIELGSQISEVFVLSGTEDLPGALAYWTATGGKYGNLHVRNITVALGGADPASESPASLVTSIDSGQSWHIFNSEKEIQPVSQADAMVAALTAQGIPATKTIVPGGAHAYDYWQTVKDQIIQWIG